MNANVVVSLSLTVVGACVGIFIWMQANGLGTDDISFVDACYGRYGPADAGCDTLADEGVEWDTPILCHSSGPADGGTYTMRAFFDAVDSFTGLDEDAAAAAGVDWMVEECSKTQALPEGAVMDGNDMTQEEWDALVEEPEGGRKLVAGRKLIWRNFEGICSSNSDMIFNHQDSAECSGRHNTNNGNAIPRCEAFLSDANYYTSQKTLGIGCLNHDACLQKSSGGCNSNCADCNPGYQTNLPGGQDCDATLAHQAGKCAFNGGGCGGSIWAEAKATSASMTSFRHHWAECKWVKTKWWLPKYLSCKHVWRWQDSPNYEYCMGPR
ncbi:hypothetical protein TeGR_g11926 [Tetraparma gracilis]|uniref:Uncharacterized protein n=1 Tax=Tetraparma gracilis TaxID=2962635 RepID=A0ABQ6MAC1_9STRA|nr:hypothetical protein TeGR_g11926 [Tetraparma gracilis]